jgi:copper transport protein
MKRIVLLAGLLFLLLPASASAHAMLLESSLVNGAVLDVPPTAVTLRFSEAFEPNFSSIELYGEDSIPIGLERASFPAADVMAVGLPDSLRPGSYTLVYRVLSAVDGHKSVGFLLFSIGTGAAPLASSVPLPAADAGPTPTAIAIKSLELLTALLLVGGLVWLVTLLLPALRSQPLAATSVRRTIWVIQWASLGLLVGTLAEFALRAAERGDGTLTSITYADIVSGLALSRWGMLALIRLALTTLVIPLVFLAGRSRGAGEAAIGLGALILLTFSMSGHAAATARPLLPIVADWLHQLMGAIWLGGVFGLAAVALVTRRTPAAERTTLLAHLIGRFSPLALISIALVTLTGVIRSLNQIPALADLWSTTYGRTLLIKLAALGGALLLGAVHWRQVGPRLLAAATAGDVRLARRFGRTVALESGLAIAVVLIAGALSQTPHPVQASASAGGTAPATLPTALPVVAQPLHLTTTAEGLSIALVLVDRRPGNRTFTAAVSDTSGLITPDRVRLRFAALDLETGQQIAILERQPDGTYAGQSGALSLLGRWQIELQVRRVNLPDVTVEWTVEMTR